MYVPAVGARMLTRPAPNPNIQTRHRESLCCRTIASPNFHAIHSVRRGRPTYYGRFVRNSIHNKASQFCATCLRARSRLQDRALRNARSRIKFDNPLSTWGIHIFRRQRLQTTGDGRRQTCQALCTHVSGELSCSASTALVKLTGWIRNVSTAIA